MNDGFAWWLVVLGIAIGVGLVWLFLVRLPRTESDVDDSELVAEAEWISRTIEGYGGAAPQPLVEEILEMHRQYLVTGVPVSVLSEPEDPPPEPVEPAAPAPAARTEDEPPAEVPNSIERQ